MLVLTRKVGERILIGNDVVVTISSMQRGRVRIGIEAPRWIHIEREHSAQSGTQAAKKRIGLLAGRPNPHDLGAEK